MKELNPSSLDERVIQAIEEMKAEQGNHFSLEQINLAELERRTGISRAKLRRLKQNNFVNKEHGLKGRKAPSTLLSGYTAVLDDLLMKGVTNSKVCHERLQEVGFSGGISVVKDYIASHKHLVPAKRQLVASQGNRGRRYSTEPGEAYQMDWGFVQVDDGTGAEFTAACFAMICHHDGHCYVEFFPNAKQENLFIGMLRGFHYMGIPEYILTDNMKSVVIKRDLDGHPIWQKDYETFMNTVGFRTKLCKPRHPFTKGKVERLVRFVKDNFLAGRTFWNISDLNTAALQWCEKQNRTYHKVIDGIPAEIHYEKCAKVLRPLPDDPAILFYLCPERRISFDGFVNYEGRRFGVPFSYSGATARVLRDKNEIHIYSADMRTHLVTYNVTWSKHDRFCEDQYAVAGQPEERPTMPVKTKIAMLQEPEPNLSFEKFNFDMEVNWDE